MSYSLIEQHFFGQVNETTHPVFPEESHKPIKPDPDTPYQPIEPAEPDIQPAIVGNKNI